MNGKQFLKQLFLRGEDAASSRMLTNEEVGDLHVRATMFVQDFRGQVAERPGKHMSYEQKPTLPPCSLPGGCAHSNGGAQL